MSSSAQRPRRVVRQIELARPGDFDEQLWPVNLALLVLAGFLAGIVLTHSDFDSVDWRRNGWVHFGGLAAIVGVLLVSTAALSRRVQRRMQLAVFCSLLLHVWLSMVGYQLHLVSMAEVDGEYLGPIEYTPLPTLPDYHHGDMPEDRVPPDEIEMPVETVPDNEQAPDVERSPDEPRPVEKPVEERSTPEDAVSPTTVDLERVEASVPRLDSALSAAEISRQMLETPDVEMPDEPLPLDEPAVAAETPEQPEAAAPSLERARGELDTQRAADESAAPAVQPEVVARAARGADNRQPEVEAAASAAAARAARELDASTAGDLAMPALPNAAERPAESPAASTAATARQSAAATAMARDDATAAAERASAEATRFRVANANVRAETNPVEASPDAVRPEKSRSSRAQVAADAAGALDAADDLAGEPQMAATVASNSPEARPSDVARGGSPAQGATRQDEVGDRSSAGPDVRVSARGGARSRAVDTGLDGPSANASARHDFSKASAPNGVAQAPLADDEGTTPTEVGSRNPADELSAAGAQVQRKSTGAAASRGGADRSGAPAGSSDAALDVQPRGSRSRGRAAGEPSANSQRALTGAPGRASAIDAGEAGGAATIADDSGTSATRAETRGGANGPVGPAAPGARARRRTSAKEGGEMARGAAPSGDAAGGAGAIETLGASRGRTEGAAQALDEGTAASGANGGASASGRSTAAGPRRSEAGDAGAIGADSGDIADNEPAGGGSPAAGKSRGASGPESAGAGELRAASRPVPRGGGAGRGKPASTGPRVEADAPDGPGGLTVSATPRRGAPSRNARDDSPMLAPSSARFVLERAGGRKPGEMRVRDMAVPGLQQRDREQRSDVARQRGGSASTERAVELGLEFLARHQNADGRWTLQDFSQGRRGYENMSQGRMVSDTAATGLAMLAFLGAGYTHADVEYGGEVSRGLGFLVGNQKPDGDLFLPQEAQSNLNVWLYSHGIAAIALCEAYGMTRDEALREPAQKALDFIVAAQHPTKGGWRYAPREGSDTSVSGWQLMALKSGELAGLRVPREAYAKVQTWLDGAQAPDRFGQYVYRPEAKQEHQRTPSSVMTAEAMLMRQYLGWTRDNGGMVASADYLRANLPAWTEERRNSYYWYYGTQMMFQMQGGYWRDWNERLKPLLVAEQVQEGVLAGSWEPIGAVPDRWGREGGRIYVTAMHLLILEVYYRHLPLYQTLEGRGLEGQNPDRQNPGRQNPDDPPPTNP